MEALKGLFHAIGAIIRRFQTMWTRAREFNRVAKQVDGYFEAKKED